MARLIWDVAVEVCVKVSSLWCQLGVQLLEELVGILPAQRHELEGHHICHVLVVLAQCARSCLVGQSSSGAQLSTLPASSEVAEVLGLQ
jgi:hypothetical protein